MTGAKQSYRFESYPAAYGFTPAWISASAQI